MSDHLFIPELSAWLDIMKAAVNEKMYVHTLGEINLCTCTVNDSYMHHAPHLIVWSLVASAHGLLCKVVLK